MPEGDTVWLAAYRLNQALGGQLLVASDFRHPRYATLDLSGWQVKEVISRGKHLLTRLLPPSEGTRNQPLTLHTHLRMDGSWRIFPETDPRLPRMLSDHRLRLVLRTPTTVALGVALPVVNVAATVHESHWVSHLGPDLLGPDWDGDLAVAHLASQPQRALGPALLDQRNLAGVGNLYKCEVLFLRGLHPWRTVETLSTPQLHTLVEKAEELLQRNKKHNAQITTSAPVGSPRSHHHWVYERGRHPCRKCAQAIERAEQTEAAHPTQTRSTYWCPHCQPG